MTTVTATCVHAWCVADHTQPGLHYEAGTPVPTMTGGPATVDLVHDERTGSTRVGVGGYELSPADAVMAAAQLLARVRLALELPQDWPSQNVARAALDGAANLPLLATVAELLDGGGF